MTGAGRCLQVAVRRGNQPEVHAHRPRAADAFELPLLQRAQELGLQRQRQLPDLVEEERAAFGELHPALLQPDGAGEGALLVTEQLRLEERFGERRAVDRDERPIGAGAVAVHGTRDELFARAAFTAQQDGRVRPGHACHAVEQLAHGTARPHHVVLEIDLGAQLLVAVQEPRRLFPLLARHRRQRRHHEQQAHVTVVERRARRRLDPDAAHRAAECHHRRGDRLPAVVGECHDVRRSIACGAVEPLRIDPERLDRHAACAPCGANGERLATGRDRQRHAATRDRVEHESGERGIELRQPADRAERRRRSQQRSQIPAVAWRGRHVSREQRIVETEPPHDARWRRQPHLHRAWIEAGGWRILLGLDHELRFPEAQLVARGNRQRVPRPTSGSPLTNTGAWSSSVSTTNVPSLEARKRQSGRPSSGPLKVRPSASVSTPPSRGPFLASSLMEE